jgi:adenosylcobyric acid synthase
VTVSGGSPFLDGCLSGSVWGTSWHGIFENDGFRRAFLTEVAVAAGRRYVPAPDVSFAAVRQQWLDTVGDLVADHLDTAAVLRLLEDGPPAGLTFVPPGPPA